MTKKKDDRVYPRKSDVAEAEYRRQNDANLETAPKIGVKTNLKQKPASQKHGFANPKSKPKLALSPNLWKGIVSILRYTELCWIFSPII